MSQVKVRLNGMAVDGWLATISTEFPDDEFRILATQLREEDAFVILEVRTPKGAELIQCFERTPEVDSVEVLHTDDQMVLIQFMTSSSKSYDPLFRSKTISIYPTVLRDGWFTVKVVAPHERLSKYTDELTAAEIPYQILSLTQSFESHELLTDRQWQVITEAVDRGYYNTPRGCTVTELAESLDVHKSAASRLLHRAESRIITEYVSNANSTAR